MDVSVIIPLFNRKHLIGYTLDSLKPEHHEGVQIQVIVVDDGSTDGAYEFVKENYSWVSLYRNPKKGAPSARNFGLFNSTAPFVHFLDSDDLVEKNFFIKKISYLKSHNDVSSVYGGWCFFNGNEDFNINQISLLYKDYPKEINFNRENHLCRLLNGWFIPINAFVHRKVNILQIGGFDEKLKINQDVHLTFKILVNFSIIGIDSGVCYIRNHDNVRVGTINNKKKFLDLILLRKAFIKELELKNIFSQKLKNALSEYLFYQWQSYRKVYPKLSKICYSISVKLNPNYKLNGGTAYKFLGNLLGNKNAVILKQSLKRK